MRMWNVTPALMCRKHLLGEHLELHMFVGTIRKGTSIAGYLAHGLLDTSLLQRRHEALVSEMHRRGYTHKSPMRYKDRLHRGSVDAELNLRELSKRCKDCRSLQRRK